MNQSRIAIVLSRHSEPTESGCWMWLGGLDRRGYGQVKLERRVQLAHRIFYRELVGPIPDGLCVCHKCDTPQCVNPDHLFIGSHADNAADRASKGRSGDISGEKHPRSKLTSEQVRHIREVFRPGRGSATNSITLGKRFGVSRYTIFDIVSGRRWSRISEKAPTAKGSA